MDRSAKSVVPSTSALGTCTVGEAEEDGTDGRESSGGNEGIIESFIAVVRDADVDDKRRESGREG